MHETRERSAEHVVGAESEELGLALGTGPAPRRRTIGVYDGLTDVDWSGYSLEQDAPPRVSCWVVAISLKGDNGTICCCVHSCVSRGTELDRFINHGEMYREYHGKRLHGDADASYFRRGQSGQALLAGELGHFRTLTGSHSNELEPPPLEWSGPKVPS